MLDKVKDNFVIAVDDHLDFETIHEALKIAGVNRQYEEIDYGYSKFSEEACCYHAVFFKNKKAARKLIQEVKDSIKDYEYNGHEIEVFVK